ncbi:MAG TPA: APC family permease, partial [Anaerolineaceae bacterium]|nr:APC family permease [Anaerolineaceae bacterium]
MIREEKNHINIIDDSLSVAPKKSWQHWVIGKPLATDQASHQTINKIVGLAVFSSDALSSVAYGPQEMMLMLIVAGTGALNYAVPIAIGIVVLLAILTISYRQTIHAYPNGGGAYIVARDNLGELAGQSAAAALLTDYILTVAVSISSGVAQIVSAYPNLQPFRVEIAIAMILFVMLINLRGVRESGITFAIPTYFFLIMMSVTLGIGLFQYLAGTLSMVTNPPEVLIENIQQVSLFLILRAFANGTSSVTGVEAISNGIPAFKEPKSKNAAQTLTWMAFILGFLLLATTFLAHQMGAMPSEQETVISQIARTIYGNGGFLYLALITATTVILIMAANTAFADFPRLGALVGSDGFLPRQMAYRGSRLVFSRGIIALALIACLLVALFQANVTSLIPLYAIGVFLSFTLSQSGMARRWWKMGHLKPGEEIAEKGSTLRYEKGWQFKMLINGFGAFCTLIVAVVFGATKFADGAWIMFILVPSLVAIFFLIHRHYKNLASQLSLDHGAKRIRRGATRVIMPIGGVHKGTLQALHFARTISEDITAVHISTHPDETEIIQVKWAKWGEGVRLVTINSPYRLFQEPLLEYINKVDSVRRKDELITIIVPQFVPKHWWQNYLHARTANSLRKALLHRPGVVITEVPYQVE